MKSHRNKTYSLAAAVMMTTLAGCGGGEDATHNNSADVPVLRMEGRANAPSIAPQEAVGMTSRSTLLTTQPTRIVLAAWNPTKKAALSSSPGPRLVGEMRAVPALGARNTNAQPWQWRTSPNGGHVAALTVVAPDAQGLRLGLLVTALPASALLRLYSSTQSHSAYQISGQEVLDVVQRNTAAQGDSPQARTWWSPDLGKSEVTLEIELPAGVPTHAVEVTVPTVSHIFESWDGAQALSPKINESAPCQKDAMCDRSYTQERDAVARMLFTNNGYSYLCTGTLLNDVKKSGTPYFLSANHCISSQTVASTLQTDWFYQSSSCNSYTLSKRNVQLAGGATLLYASESTDVSFMQLLSAPPAGAYFAGWDASGTAQPDGTAIFGFHHPMGDMLKISMGKISGQISCTAATGTQFTCSGSSGNFYAVNWSSGATESGSSGSALLSRDGKYVVGTLYGGTGSCSNPDAVDIYGRFDISFQAALKDWLTNQKEDPSEKDIISNAIREIHKILRNY